MKPQSKTITLHGKNLKAPLKTLADTTKRRAYQLDTQAMGKPDYDWAQVEEFRTKIQEEDLEILSDDERSESRKEELAANLKRPGIYSSDNLRIAYFGCTKAVSSEMTQAHRTKLIDVANKAGMHAVVLPPVYDPSVEKVIENFENMEDYARRAIDSEITVIPAINITDGSPEWVDEVAERIQEEFTVEETPIIATDGFFPTKNAGEFATLREKTDRAIMVTDSHRKIFHDMRGEDGPIDNVSAEVLLAAMGADIIGQYFHTGGYSNEEEDQDVVDIEVDLMEGNSMKYREDITIEDADVISCDCMIHGIMDDDQFIRYFGSQNKVNAAKGIHNESRVPQAIRALRNYVEADKVDEFRNEYKYLDSALEEIEGE